MNLLRPTHALRVFHAIRTNPGIMQKEIREMTGAERSTVSSVLQGFEAAGLIRRVAGESKKGQRGRPAEGYELSPTGGLLIGVHPRPHEVRYVGATLDGKPITTLVMPMPDDMAQLPAQVMNAIQAVSMSVGSSVSDVRAVGVCVPGVVGREGTLLVSPNLVLRGVEIGQSLRAELPMPVFVENNSAGAALAEHLFARSFGAGDFFYIESGIGVGGGLLVDGNLHRGYHGFANEIGHTKIVPDGRQCRCGNKGCISAYTADPNILARAAETGLTFADMPEMLAAARRGDEAVIAHLNETGRYLGFGLANMLHMLDVPEIVFGGTFARGADFILEGAKEAMERNLLEPFRDTIQLTTTRNTSETPLGGVAVALDGVTNAARGKAPLAPA
ncbi:ROK family transcriptional regulator [Pseudoroseicyclus sp. H15]